MTLPPKYAHEIRDPIHTFIRVTSDERKVIDSRAFQRLRDIHQLALTYLVYPAATHRRFEHCLGVMDLAGRVFDVITHHDNRRDETRDFFRSDHELDYWRSVVRMGALCHDLGHMPFSHGAEELLPRGYHHEQLSVDMIYSPELRAIFEDMTPPLKPKDVAKVAVGLKSWPGDSSDFSPWDELMTEIVTGNAFGVDRVDYLLRDSHHAGVGYGRFDHHRLIDSLRILRWNDKPVIGIERGGMHAAEALQLARYFMFEQLYFHRVRRALDLHLKQFLRAFLPNGTYPTEIEKHLALTDNEVLAAMRKAADEPGANGHIAARRILCREFHRVVYSSSAEDRALALQPTDAIHQALAEKFGAEFFEKDTQLPSAKPMVFAVETDSGEVVPSTSESQVLGQVPAARFDFVFAAKEKLAEARQWLSRQRIRGILGAANEEAS